MEMREVDEVEDVIEMIDMVGMVVEIEVVHHQSRIIKNMDTMEEMALVDHHIITMEDHIEMQEE